MKSIPVIENKNSD